MAVSFRCFWRRRDSSFGVRLGRGVLGGMRVMGCVDGDVGRVVKEITGGGRGGGEDGVFVGFLERRLRLWASIEGLYM